MRIFKMRTFPILIFLLFAIWGTGLSSASAADDQVGIQNTSESKEDKSKTQGQQAGIKRIIGNIIEPLRAEFLEIELPDTQRRHEVKVSVRPRIEDIIKSDYLRTPVSFRYGLLRNVSLSLGPNFYLHNPKRGTLGIGMSNLNAGIKYGFKHILKDVVHMAFAVGVIYPVGSNPELMDGYVHYRPSFIVSKTFPEFYDVVVVSSIGMDIIDKFKKKGKGVGQ